MLQPEEIMPYRYVDNNLAHEVLSYNENEETMERLKKAIVRHGCIAIGKDQKLSASDENSYGYSLVGPGMVASSGISRCVAQGVLPRNYFARHSTPV